MADLILVDDDTEMAETLADLLRDEGHAVRLARNGEEGIALLAAARPELILCDVEMPGLDGPGMALRVLLRDAGDERIPIVLLSGVADLRRVARRIGTPYFIAKPFELDRLLDLLDRALAERTAPDPPREA